MRFSILSSFADTPRGVDSTWDDLVASIRTHVVTTDKGSVPLYCPATFPAGAPRQLEYVESISFGVVDLDHMTHAAVVVMLAHIQTLPFRWFLTTTHSHGALADDDSPNPKGSTEYAYRILFPFLSPVPGNEWKDFWPRMAAMFVPPQGGYRVDPKCKPPIHSYYVPSTHPERAHLATSFERADLPQFDPAPLRMECRIESSGKRSSPNALPSLTGEVVGAPKVSRGALEALASRLKRKKIPTGEALAKVLDGIPWDDKGNRDDTLYKLAGDIAKEFPLADMREVAAFFTLSVDRLRDIDAAAGNPVYTLDDVVAKLLRRQGEIATENAQREAAEAAERETRIRSAFREKSQERALPYTEAEVDIFATLAGVSVVEFNHRWIIQTGGTFYFYFDGNYVGPIKEADGTIAARKYLAPAPVDVDSKDAFGRVTPRSIQSLAAEYGTHVLNVVADLNSDLCVVDTATSTLVEAPCPLRPLRALFDPAIDHWLKLIAGEKFDLLCDWISWITDLDRPCTALFLQGEPGAGKGLLACGLSRLWTKGDPTTMEQALGQWTDPVLRCPLIFADERVPKDNRGNARTEDIRQFIQQRERPLKRRFCGDAVMRGATRSIIAANNRSLLQSNEAVLTVHDIKAIADRILLIPVGEKTPHYLAAIGQAVQDSWVQGDKIAQHALWIIENRIKAANPPRFLVQGANANLHMDIAFGTSIGSAVAHWLVSFLEDPAKLWVGKHPSHSAFGITYTNLVTGQFSPGIVVSAQCVSDNWETYKTNVRPEKANIRSVGLSLQALSEGRITWTFPTTKRLCNRIPLSNLMVWGEENGFHSDTLLAHVARLEAMLIARGGAGAQST